MALLLPMLLLFSLCSKPALLAGPADEMFKIGRDHMNLSNFDKARDHFLRATQIEPDRAEAFYQLGLAAQKLQQNEQAFAAFERAHQLAPDVTDHQKSLAAFYVTRAKEAREAGNKLLMQDNLEKSCRTYPQATTIWLALFESWRTDRQWSKIATAGEVMKRGNRTAIDIGDDQKLQQALLIVAIAHKESSNIPKAQEYIRAAEMIRRSNEALESLKRDIQGEGEKIAAALLAEGQALFDAKRYKEAIEKLKLAQGANARSALVTELIDKATKELQVADFFKAAKEAVDGRNFAEALDLLQRAQGFDPENQRITDEIASITAYQQVLQNAEDKRNAELLARKTEAIERKRRFDSLMQAAQENIAARSFESGILSYQQALEMDPENAEISQAIAQAQELAARDQQRAAAFAQNLAKAQERFREGDYSSAFDILAKANQDPLNPKQDMLPVLAESALRLDRPDEAEGYLHAWKELAGAKASAKEQNTITYFQGVIEFKRGKFAEAWTLLAEVKNKDPGISPDLGGMIWKLRWNKYQWGVYVVLFFLMFPLFSALKNTWNRLRQMHAELAVKRALATGDYEKIIPVLEQRLTDGGYVENRRQLSLALAEAYLRQGRHQEAFTWAKEVLLKDSRNANARRILGECCFKLEDNSPEGIEHVNNLFRLDESRRDLLAFLVAQFRTQKADHKLAMEVYQKQIALNPDDHDTIMFLAALFFKRQKFDATTAKIFERAVRCCPDEATYTAGLLQCLKLLGRAEEAEKLQEKAQEKWPNHHLFTSLATTSQQDFFSQPQQHFEIGQGGLPIVDDEQLLGLSIDDRSPLATAADGVSGASDASDAATQSGNAAIPVAQQSISGPEVKCQHCGTANSTREYYCSSCGRPL